MNRREESAALLRNKVNMEKNEGCRKIRRKRLYLRDPYFGPSPGK